MRSKRLLTMLLVLAMLLSAVSPAVYATAPVEHSFVGAQNKEAETTKSDASPFENDRVVSSDNAVGTNNLRDENGYIPNVEETELAEAEGKWNTSDVEGKLPDSSLTLPETPDSLKELKEAAELYSADEMVNAFVVMEDKPLAETYRSPDLVSWFDENALLKLQNKMIKMIEKFVLEGAELDVRYQFTYLTNAFSVETAFGNLAEIAQMDGVKSVYLMPVYSACTTSGPNATSGGVMTGVPTVWRDLGYRGEGMKIAIIDTGLDLDHPSFAEHDDFAITDTSLTVEDINAVLKDLNAYDLRNTVVGKTLYRSAKVPFAFNYVDRSLTADHSADMQGDHGTHVAGIAAANDNVAGTDVVGMAPEAQIIVMKVFGANGGAYMDDIIAALEDAMTLGCDVANLSLGSPAGFSSENEEVDAVFARIAEQDIVVCISAGNEGTSAYGNMWGTDLNTSDNPDNGTLDSPGAYANATTVASVDNAVVMTPYFSVGAEKIFYMDPYLYTVALPDIIELYGDTYEYVIIDGVGEEADFYDEEGNSLVDGKIAIIRRGETSFASKIYNAAYANAAAAIIWNNTTDDIFTFGMQISEDGENYPWIPAALITVEDGQLLADAEEKVIVLSAKPGERASAAGGQMSSFSSWGVAPDLDLEPDISGVGGNVYSCYDGGTYGIMSGTSMSSPQVAGVAALVMQYLHETFPDAPQGDLRDLANALMMSNAEVVINSDYGVEASPRQQGAGLVNAAAAISAQAYLTVNGGKPKVNLGDGATGTYTFSFEVHNFGDETNVYTPSASLLTEAVADGGVAYFMYGIETELSGAVTFDQETITVAPGETVTVNATITLSEDDKNYFAAAYPNGGYVEGFVYLNSLDAESLNLPFMGFYGDWTQAPVFDSAYWYDNSFWGVAPVDGIPEGHEYYHVMWTDLAGTDWVLGFNPYTGVTVDENGNVIYDPANNSVSPNGDGVLDNLTEMYVSLMRNAKTLTITYTDAETGEVLSEEVISNARKTMYRTSYGQVVPWLYSWYGMGMYDFTDANGEYLPNNTQVLLTISGEVDYADGGDHSIQIPITVDTQAPKLRYDAQYTYKGNQLVLWVTENVALADVFIMNKSMTQTWAEQPEFTEIYDGLYQVKIDVSGLGKEFVVVLCDYAGNESYTVLTYDNFFAGENLPVVDTSKLYGYRVYDNYIYSDHMYGWISMNKPASAEEEALISVHTDDYMEYTAINAAEYVGGKLFAVDALYNLVIMTPGLWDRTTVANLGVNVLDMTFDDSTDTMYVLAKADDNVTLCSMNLLTGELTALYEYGYYYYAPLSIADDDNGTLFVNKNNSSNIFTLDENYEMVALADADGNAIAFTSSDGSALKPTYAQSMTYSEGVLYWSYFTSSWRGETSELICIHVDDLTAYGSVYTSYAYDSEDNLVQYYPTTEVVGLHFLNETEYQIPAAEALESLWVEETTVILGVGDSQQVKANPIPWNYNVTGLQWTSSDEAVVTVDNKGVITGVAEGNAIVTATCGEVSVSFAVIVVDVDGNFYAYNYYSGDGNYGYMIDVDLGKMNYALTALSPEDFIAGDYNGHDGYFYGYTEAGQLWRYDQTTGEIEKVGVPSGILPVDMAYDYSTGLMYVAVVDYNYGLSFIYAVNMSNGQLLPVMEVYDYLMTLACDTEGNVYSITMWGDLIQIDMTTGEMFYLASGMGELQYMQSMCYDHVNNVILWACPEQSVIYWIDINNEIPYVLNLGDPTGSGLLEFVGMYTIPETIPELADVAIEEVYAEDMVILAGTEKDPTVTVLPFNATSQKVGMTSSDENVVAATEDGKLLGVAEGSATVSYQVTDSVSGEVYEGTFEVTVLIPADDVYGHVLTDIATMGGQYWVRLYPSDPSSPDMMEATEYVIYSEEYYDGKLYAYGYDPNIWSGSSWRLFVMDPVSHAILDTKEMDEGFPFVYDLTYDYATSTMYAVAGPSDNASDIYVVNMETGELILLLETEEFFMNIAATDNGIYLMEPSVASGDSWDPWAPVEYGNATLYKFDPIAKTTEIVGDTGVKSNMLSSMTYDYDTGILYWTPLFQGSSYVSSLTAIDLETGLVASLGAVGTSGAQVSGLYIISENFPEEKEPTLNDLLVAPKKASVTAGMTTEIAAYVLPLSLDAELSWTSSDESVATVEDGVVTGIKQGKTTITVTATYGDVTKTASCQVAVLDAEAGFLTYNSTDGGWAAISRADMTVVKPLTVDEETGVQAITNIGDIVYGYDANNTLFTLDTTTYERTEIGAVDATAHIADYLLSMGYTEEDVAAEIDLYAFEIRDLAYDAVNERLLALGNVYDVEWGELNYGNGIYQVDLETGALELLYTFEDIYSVMAIAVDEVGNVINYNAYNDFYAKLDLATGVNTNIVSLQTQSVYGDYESDHTLYYDELTGLVYHLFTSNGNFYRMYEMDPASGALALSSEYVGEVIYDEESWADIGDSYVGLCFVEMEIPVICEHVYDEVTFTWAEDYSCEVSFECTECGKTVTDVAEVSTEVIPADCVTPGAYVYTATYGEFSDTKEEEIPAGHSYEEAITTEPTCEEEGVLTFTCYCGASYTEAIPALGHEYEAVVTDPTCEEDGYTTYTCHCGDSYTDDVVPALGHEYEAVVTDPTCEEDGYTTYTCHCGDTYTDDVVPATGHNYKNGKCTECGAKQPGYNPIGEWIRKLLGKWFDKIPQKPTEPSKPTKPGFNWGFNWGWKK